MAERAAAMLCQLIVRMLPPGASTRARIASNAANSSGAAAFSRALFFLFRVFMFCGLGWVGLVLAGGNERWMC